MINKLVSEIKKKNAPIVVGLDPMLSYVPEHIQKKAFEEFGETNIYRKRHLQNTERHLREQQRQSGSSIKL